MSCLLAESLLECHKREIGSNKEATISVWVSSLFWGGKKFMSSNWSVHNHSTAETDILKSVAPYVVLMSGRKWVPALLCHCEEDIQPCIWEPGPESSKKRLDVVLIGGSGRRKYMAVKGEWLQSVVKQAAVSWGQQDVWATQLFTTALHCLIFLTIDTEEVWAGWGRWYWLIWWKMAAVLYIRCNTARITKSLLVNLKIKVAEAAFFVPRNCIFFLLSAVRLYL